MLLKKITLEVPSEMVNYLEHYGKKMNYKGMLCFYILL